MGDCAAPTTSPRLLTLPAVLAAPPRLPRSWIEPSFSHKTACDAVVKLMAKGGRPVVEHKPDAPTTWPSSLIVKANATVSPFDTSGESTLWISPFGPQTTGKKSLVRLGPLSPLGSVGPLGPSEQLGSGVSASATPLSWPRLLIHKGPALFPPGRLGSAVITPSLQIAPRVTR